MEFWGVEVKAGDSLPVFPEEGQLIHISQVALGDAKNVKSANSVHIRLTVGDKKFVIGTLSAERVPQISFDLVLERKFELSHDWNDGSVYVCGYIADDPDVDQTSGDEYLSEEDEVESEDEELEVENGKPVAAVEAAKSTDSKAASIKPGSRKPKVTLVDPKKVESDDSDSSDDDVDDDVDEDVDDESDEDDSDDDMSEDEETPKKETTKKETSKKRPSDSVAKSPSSTKKSKTVTPKKTDGKKGSAHAATPHPKKSAKKTAESPKSSGSASCKTCSKTFNNEKGLESHTKAKHAGK